MNESTAVVPKDYLEVPVEHSNGNQEVSRAPMIPTTGAWTCTECRTFNNPNTFTEDMISWTPMLCAQDVVRQGLAWKIGRGGWRYLPLWRL